MENGLKVGKENPKTSSNVFSKLLFGWAVELVKKSAQRSLKISDLYKVLPPDESEKLANRLERHWENELAKSKTKKYKPSLFKALLRTFFVSYMIQGILQFIQFALIRTYQPVILAQLINSFSSSSQVQNTSTDMYMSSGVLVAVTFILIFMNHHSNLDLSNIGMRIRVASSSLVYRKLLRLSRVTSEQAASGQIVNLLSNDVNRFDMVAIFLHFLWITPIQVAILTYYIWQQVGIASLSGVVLLAVLTVPLQGYLTKLTTALRLKAALRTDNRVKKMNEIINGIQVIKMYAWEKPFEAIVKTLRIDEIKVLTYLAYMKGIFLSFSVFTERLALYITVVCYVLLGNTITAEKAFSMVQFFNNLQLSVAIFFPMAANIGAETLVTIGRLEEFLALEERPPLAIERGSDKSIVVSKVDASWVPQFKTLSNLNVNVKPGTLCAVIGPVGSGKSSFLQLLLGELYPESGSIRVGGTVSYASQEPWLFVSTVRRNILFGEKYEREHYRAVVKVCALERDFELFSDGDKTFVGERGVSLSGGQRARINLARAVYKNADVYLLDDPLSAVDTHVGKQLFQDCILDHLKGKTRILVTHQLQYLKAADHIIVLSKGEIEAQGTFDELSKSNVDFTKLLLAAGEEETEKRHKEVDIRRLSVISATSLKSVEARSEAAEFEERNEETYNEKQEFGVYKEYITAGAGSCLLITLLFLLILAQVVTNAADLWLRYWTDEEAKKIEIDVNCALATPSLDFENTTNTSVTYEICTSADTIDTNLAIYIYSGLMVGCIVTTIFRSIMCLKIVMKASRMLHNRMFYTLIRTPMRFFDTNPSGRILNRFSRDMGAIDEVLPRVILETLQVFLVMLGILVMVIIANPYMAIIVIMAAYAMYKLRSLYVTTTKNVKHLEGITKSPVFSHLNASLNGLTTIRASGAEVTLKAEFDSHQDVHSSAFYMSLACFSVFGLWLDLICGLLIACIIAGFILMHQYGTISDSMAGLAISQSLILTGMVQYGMRQMAEAVSQMTCVERVTEYSKLEKESPIDTPKDKVLPKEWPRKGRICFSNLSLFYTPNDFPVLKNLNFVIEHGEKVGIVGRTGAGKSSLISALFRLAPLEGDIIIDDVNTRDVGLSLLRSNIAIIPQEPVLFSASLRFNLDPFDEFDDDALWSALEEVEMKQEVQSLQFVVQEGGSNFSVGQRQLLCLARAILRNNKILVLDEATANVDHRTDALIQATIRRKFADCTVLTIAHRLNTIMDSDKVMVMEAGRMVEFDHPHKLLANTEGHFYKMVAQMGKNMTAQLHAVASESYFKDVEETRL